MFAALFKGIQISRYEVLNNGMLLIVYIHILQWSLISQSVHILPIISSAYGYPLVAIYFILINLAKLVNLLTNEYKYSFTLLWFFYTNFCFILI